MPDALSMQVLYSSGFLKGWKATMLGSSHFRQPQSWPTKATKAVDFPAVVLRTWRHKPSLIHF